MSVVRHSETATAGYSLEITPERGRAWRFRDDPEHAWIRATWADQELDERLPLTAAAGKTTT